MGKRIPLIISILSLLISPLISLYPAQAEVLDIDDTKYWTMDEIETAAEEYQQAKVICGGNMRCENYIERAFLAIDEEFYSAVLEFSNYYFMISAIDPATSTIKVLFHDEFYREWLGKKDIDVFKNLYLFWWEDGEPEFNLSIFKNESENRHEIFTRLAEEDGAWLTPNKEVEIKVPDFNFEILETTPIYFLAQSKLSDALSMRHFEDCLTKIKDKTGYECRATFDWQGNISYQPAAIKISTSDIRVPTTPVTETVAEVVPQTIIKEKEIPVFVTSDNTSTGGDMNSSSADFLEATVLSTEPMIAQKTGQTAQPEQIEVPLAAAEKEHVFPWWLVVFIFSGIFLILWWCIPAKKFKKTLDK